MYLSQTIYLLMYSFFDIRCSINTTSDQIDIVSKAMDGFLDTIPGSASDAMEFLQVRDYMYVLGSYWILVYSQYIYYIISNQGFI